MPKDESTWKLRASTPFIYESEENVAQKFIHGGRSRVPKTAPKTPKSVKTSKKVDNMSSLKSQTFTPVHKKSKSPHQASTFKSKTCNFDAEMAASPVAISHKYYEYITDANAKYNVNGMGAFRKFKPDVPTITCKPQVFDWNLNLQQNILHKPKDSSADLRYNGGKTKPISPPPPPTPMPQSSRKETRMQDNPMRAGYVNKLDDNLSPSTLGLIRKIIRDRSRNNMRAKNRGSLNTDSDSTLDGVYVNIPSSSRQKPKNMRRVPQPQNVNKEIKYSSTKRLKSAVKISSNNKVPRVLKKGSSPLKNTSSPLKNTSSPLKNTSSPLKNTSSPLKNTSTSHHVTTKSKSKKTSVAKKLSPKDVKKKDRKIKND